MENTYCSCKLTRVSHCARLAELRKAAQELGEAEWEAAVSGWVADRSERREIGQVRHRKRHCPATPCPRHPCRAWALKALPVFSEPPRFLAALPRRWTLPPLLSARRTGHDERMIGARLVL